MAGFLTLLAVYLFGGLTFLPLILAAFVYYGTRPVPPSSAIDPDDPTAPTPGKDGAPLRDDYNYDGLARPGDDVAALEAIRREHAQTRARQGSDGGEARKRRPEQADEVATAGYFAVMRKYVAMGVNTKPVEPSTVGPTPVAPPSPSVYQNFFRNMLNSKKQQPGSEEAVEISRASAPRPKNARNMFYVVLRHGHLILFDDDQQVDVRHVIKLADHEVGVYSGHDVIPEGELFIKRNALVLSPKEPRRVLAHNTPAPRPWFFYSENCSEKEDFYFALVRGQPNAPVPREIDVRHLTSLMERLHSSEEAAEMRWFNAVLGRLFLGVYKTPDLLEHFKKKVVTKLSRTPRPGFISKLHVQRVDIGETTPQFTSPRLKSLTADGECIIEADVRYAGHIEIDIAATFRVSMGISQQEVKTQLAVVLTRLDGHIMFKIKAPPSNRIWFSFRHMPKVEMEVRPIIMSRQFTWPVFIQMIENRIKEAMAESIVLPFWDDVPFFATEQKKYRGGIWEEEAGTDVEDPLDNGGGTAADAASILTTETGESVGVAAGSSGVSVNGDGDDAASPAVMRLRRLSKSYTAPVVSPATTPSGSSLNRVATGALEKGRASLAKRRQKKHSVYGEAEPGSDHQSSATISSSKNTSTASLPNPFIRTTSSLTSSPVPIAETDNVHAEVFKASASPPKGGKTAMDWLSSRAPPERKSSVSSAESDSALGQGGRGKRHIKNQSSGQNDIFEDSTEYRHQRQQHTSSDSETAPVEHNRKAASDGDLLQSATAEDDEAFDSAPDALPEYVKKEQQTRGRASTASSGRSTAFSSARASVASLSVGGSESSAATLGPGDAAASATFEGGDPDAAQPQKRTVAIAAAVSGAAGAAKRWGIGALQRRQAAAQERAKQRAQAQFNNGEPLDLSKPMGGGMPLPPPGEPLPRPSELAKEQQQHQIHRKPMPLSRRTTEEFGREHESSSSENVHKQQQQQKQRRRSQATLEEKLRAIALANAPPPQQELLVVEAPIESESDEESADEAGGDGRKESSVEVAAGTKGDTESTPTTPARANGALVTLEEADDDTATSQPAKSSTADALASKPVLLHSRTLPAKLVRDELDDGYEDPDENGTAGTAGAAAVDDDGADNWGTLDESVLGTLLEHEPKESKESATTVEEKPAILRTKSIPRKAVMDDEKAKADKAE